MRDVLLRLLIGTLGAAVAIGGAEAQQRPGNATREAAYREYVTNLIKDRPESQEYQRPLRKEEPFNNYQCLGIGEGFCPCCAANPLYKSYIPPPNLRKK